MANTGGSHLWTRLCILGQGCRCSEILSALNPQRTRVFEVNGKLSFLKSFKYTSPCSEIPSGLFVSGCPAPWGCVRMHLGGGSTHRVPREPLSPGCVAHTSEGTWRPGAATFWARRLLLPAPPAPCTPPLPTHQALAAPFPLSSFCWLGHPCPQQITWVLCFTFSL